MNKTASSLLLAILPLFANADPVEIDGLYYNLNLETRTAEITRNPNNYSGNLTIPEAITYEGDRYSVTSIDYKAFAGCSDLSTLEIPNSISIIGNEAFVGCSGLSKLELPNNISIIGNEAFYGCSGLFSLVIPNSLKKISFSTFAACSGLTTVTIPNSVTNIGDNAFGNCTGLSSIEIPNSVTTIGDGAFNGCISLSSVEIPNSVTTIGDGAFNGCTSLSSVEIPNSVTSIGGGAFCGCSSLISGTIPNSILSMGDAVFQDCTNLSSVYLPEGITSIGNFFFSNCSSLTSLKIPDSVISIGNSIFSGCSSLTSLEIPNRIETIPGNFCSDCTSLSSVNIPQSVTSIESRAFYGCTNLSSVLFPTDLATVGSEAFENTLWYDNQPDGVIYIGMIAYKYKEDNSSATSVEIKQGTVKIADSAFSNCKSIVSVRIPNGVKSIGDGCFYGCSNLSNVFIPESVTSIGTWAFFCTPWYDNQPDGIVYAGKVAYEYKGQKTKITSLEIKEGTVALSNSLFADFIDLTSILLPNSIHTIGDGVFSGCTNLTNVNLPEGITFIGYHTFADCSSLKFLTLPESVTYIGDAAFRGCSSLLNIDIPKGVKKIDVGAFENCSNLVSIIIPEDIQTICAYVFAGCKNLQSITIPEGVTTIETGAFANCNNLSEVSIPRSIRFIGSSAFAECYSLKAVYISDIKSWCEITFEFNSSSNPLEFAHHLYLNNKEIKELIIPNGISSIQNFAFYNCEITSVSLPQSIESIGNEAFYGCNGLTSIILPNKVTTIGFWAFVGCNSLTKVISLSANPPSADLNAFFSFSNNIVTNNLMLFVPDGSVEAYKKENPWKNFMGIVEMSINKITIGNNGKTSFIGTKALDFTGFDNLKAYVATGYESDGTIWLTRIKLVPANTPILVKGEANETYEVPVLDKCDAYFENMFKGSADEDMTISATTADGKYKNFYMAGGQFKPASDNYTLKAGKCYLQVPATFNAAKVGEDQTVKIADSGKSSYAPPVDIDLTDVEGLKAYAATGYDAANSTIWLTRINKIQAGEGVMLKGEAGKEYTLPSAEVQAYYGNMFVGNIGDKITIGETSDDGEWTNFYLASGSFKKVSGTREIGTNKSYLQLPTSLLVSSARGKNTAGIDEWFIEELETETLLLGSIGGEDEDGTTRIDAITNDNAQPDVYYNLQGQRVDNPKKGLYIRNGRKVVIK